MKQGTADHLRVLHKCISNDINTVGCTTNNLAVRLLMVIEALVDGEEIQPRKKRKPKLGKAKR